MEPPTVANMGASQLWLKSKLAPAYFYGVWKFQHAVFKGSGNIKGGVKHTKMDKNRVKNFSHNAKSQNKLSHIQPSTPVNISPKKLRKLELRFSTPPCTNCVRGWCPRYGAFFRGFSVLPKGSSKIDIFAYICTPGGPQWGYAWQFDPAWGPNLGVTPDSENFVRQPLRVSTYPANLMWI